MLKTLNYKKLAVAVIFAVALATPIAIRAQAQEGSVAEEIVIVEETTELEQVEQEETTVVNEPEEVLEQVDQEEVIEENEEPVVEEVQEVTPVTLVDAIEIAKQEHPNVEVVMAKVKLKLLDEEKVFKVVFADGWRIYVRASDGTIVLIKDRENDKRDCSERGLRAVNEWRTHYFGGERGHRHHDHSREDIGWHKHKHHSHEEEMSDSDDDVVVVINHDDVESKID